MMSVRRTLRDENIVAAFAVLMLKLRNKLTRSRVGIRRP